MHDTALRIGGLALEIYTDLNNAAVLDVGSYDVNGSLRQFAKPGTRYVGVDIEQGPGVDIVTSPGAGFPVEDDSFDIVVATSVLEHDPVFWATIQEMCRKVRPGGFVYFNAPSNGIVHRYPYDNWRFYPDAAFSMARWVSSQGLEVELVESFIAEREDDIWNDFVAVLRRLPAERALPRRALYQEVRCCNILRHGSAELLLPRDASEDMVLLSEARAKARAAEAEVLSLKVSSSTLGETLRDHQDEYEKVSQRLNEERSASEKLRDSLERQQKALEEQIATSASLFADAQVREADLKEKNRNMEGEILRLMEDVSQENLKYSKINAELLILKEEEELTARALAAAEVARVSLEQEMNVLLGKIAELDQRLEHTSAALLVAKDEAGMAQARIQERNREIGILSMRIVGLERKFNTLSKDAVWMNEVCSVLTAKAPAWWAFMPRAWRQSKLHDRLLRHGLFDAGAYLRKYSDVSRAGIDPFAHYIRHGKQEGRTWQ